VQLIERGAKAFQDRIFGRPGEHWSFSIHNTYNITASIKMRMLPLFLTCRRKLLRDAAALARVKRLPKK
jgi:hypothetical protein